MTIERITSYIAPTLGAPATSGQPSVADLQELARAGVETIINLGLLDPRYCLEDEAGEVRRLGLRYVHIPVDFEAPLRSDFLRFTDALSGLEGRSVLVHCAANYRATCFVALYSEKRLGWSREQSDAYISRVWAPNSIWSAFLREMRSERPG